MMVPMLLKHLTICVRDICNFDCKYCYRTNEAKKKNNIFDRSKQDLLYKLLLSNQIEYDKELHVCFTGGEPLLSAGSLEIIVDLHNKLERLEADRGVKVKFGVITNLCFPDALLTFLVTWVLDREGVCVTCHNEIVMAKLEYLANFMNLCNKHYFDILVKVPVTKENVGRLYMTLKRLQSMGYKTLQYFFVNGTDDYDDEEFDETFREELASIRQDTDLNNMLLNYITMKYGRPYPYCDKMGKMLYVDTSGNLWPCSFYSNDSKVHGLPDIENYKLGNLFDGGLSADNDIKHISEEVNSDWKEHFCYACSEKCKNNIRRLKQIEIEEFIG